MSETEAWKKEAEDWERGVREFGRPMDPDHNHHEVRDWLNEAFNAGTLAANGEAFDLGRSSVIEPVQELLRLVRGRMMHNHGLGVECGSCLMTHRIDSFLTILKPDEAQPGVAPSPSTNACGPHDASGHPAPWWDGLYEYPSSLDVKRLRDSANELLRSLREVLQWCPCTLRERESGHLTTCFAPDVEGVIAKAEGK